MIPSHDLKDIRARFDKGFESLKEVLRVLEESYADYERCDTRESRRPLKAKAKDWLDQCKDFRERLPKRLPPFVRDDLWNKREIGKRVQIAFKLKDGFSLKKLSKGQQGEIKEAGGRESWRLPPWQVTSDTFATVSLTADWPDIAAIENEAEDVFETYATLAEKHPADFRLWPRLPSETTEEIVEILTRLNVLDQERIGKRWPDGSNEQAFAHRLYNAGAFDSSEPITGATFKMLSDGLGTRWPDIKGRHVNNGILDAFRKGLICAFGGEAAHKKGYAPEDIGEIVNCRYMRQWLKFDHTRRPFAVVFELREAATQQTKAETPAEKVIEKSTLASAILLEEPEISPTELAKRVGVTRSTLYSSRRKWAGVRRTLLARGNAYAKGEIDANGNLEAWRDADKDE